MANKDAKVNEYQRFAEFYNAKSIWHSMFILLIQLALGIFAFIEGESSYSIVFYIALFLTVAYLVGGKW